MEVIFSEGENIKFKVTSLSKKEDSFIVDKTLQKPSADELQSAIRKTVPVVLTLSGSGIIHRKIEDASQDTASAFSKLFPSANLRDFYVQRLMIQKIIQLFFR